MQMVVIRIARMMGDNRIRPRFQQSLFNKLHQMQVRDRVQLDIGKAAHETARDRQYIPASRNIGLQLLIGGSELTRLHRAGENAHIDLMPLLCKPVHRSSRAEDLIVRMRGDD